jgi:4-diphosphocytidyl-2-C-methyl-D-erythritol kinase
LTASFSETAYAKINLALHVRARGADGYHRLETLFVFAEDGDQLEAEPAGQLSLQVTGSFASPLLETPDNLVLRAAEQLRRAFGIREGAAVLLDKRLPVASGIGGGSADAAAAIRMLCRMWAISPDEPALARIARDLGADVPACVVSRAIRGEGRGDELLPIDSAGLSGLPLLLINPGVAVATGPVFAGWDGRDRGPLGRGDPLTAAIEGGNDLESPAIAIAPVISEVVRLLVMQDGVALARMSGSGATCFALFRDLASRDMADRAIATMRPGWWRLKTALR